MRSLSLLFFIAAAVRVDAVPQCPQNAMVFDLERCDPLRRSQCPSGFTCRKGTDPDRQTSLIPIYLCCETSSMSIADWFYEMQLSPQIIPQPPLAMLNSIEMIPLDANTAFPTVHTGDEVVILTFPDYATAAIRYVEFMTAPSQGGFLHIMTIIDPSTKPFAVFLNYNLPSTGFNRLLVPDMPQGMTGSITYFDNSTAIIKQDSYRSQYVVLVLRTNNAISIGNTNQGSPSQGHIYNGLDLMSGCNDVQCLLTNTNLGRELGQPIAGSVFHITTNRTMFHTVEIMTDQLTQASAGVFIYSVVLLLGCLLFA